MAHLFQAPLASHLHHFAETETPSQHPIEKLRTSSWSSATMALWSIASLLTPQNSFLSDKPSPKPHLQPLAIPRQSLNHRKLALCCSAPKSTPPSSYSPAIKTAAPPVLKKRKRHRKEYPGESKGITEEMRFVALKLRNVRVKRFPKSASDEESEKETWDSEKETWDSEKETWDSEKETWVSEAGMVSSDDYSGDWKPSFKGFLRHLVDSKLVFDTVERIVAESTDVAYVYFRKTGLERSQSLSRDLEWFRQQGVAIPEPSRPGVSYSQYLEHIAVKNASLFLCHFYTIYFSHIAGGQVIAKQVSEKILNGKELEFYQWEGNVQELLRSVRENLNKLGEHWGREVKNKCLSETKKSYRFLGEIVRLIIL